MKNVGKIWSVFLCLIVKEVWNQICADPAKFGEDLKLGRMSPETPFLELPNFGLVQCMELCIQHALCKSINFKDDNKCELLSRDDLDIQTEPNSVYNKRQDWSSKRFAGECANHECANNSQCVPQRNGSVACVILGCVAPTNASGHVHAAYSKVLWTKGETLIIPCPTSDHGSVEVKCNENGQWSQVFCLPVDCADAGSRGMNFSEEIEIDVDGPAGSLNSFNVSCKTITMVSVTVVEHNSGELVSSGHEDAFSQHFDIKYDADLDAITQLIKISQSCFQRIQTRCTNTLTQFHAAWVTRRNNLAEYFAGANTSYVGCSCGLNGTCDTPQVKCNCDVNDNTERYDDGMITNMDDLPVIGYRSGDTGSDLERSYVIVGPLRCRNVHQ